MGCPPVGTWTFLWPPHINLCFYFGFQLVLKIQEIFDSKRGKKKVKVLSPAGREAAPVKGIEVSSTTVCALNTLSGTIPLPPGLAPPPHADTTMQTPDLWLELSFQLKEHLPNPKITWSQGGDSEPGELGYWLKVLFQKSRLKQKFLRKPLGMRTTSDCFTHRLCALF